MIKAIFENNDNIRTEALYQWDSYQSMIISGVDFGTVAPNVHFCNKKSSEALVVTTILNSDGSVTVSVPNTLLMEKYDIVAYIYENSGIASKTIKSVVIPIISRLKPTSYSQPSNEDIAEIEEIELQAKSIINNLTASEYSDDETYTRPNIVYYNYSTYLCNSNTEIQGINPSNTTYWQMICKSNYLSNITKGEDGKLNFILTDGTVVSIDFLVIDTGIADDDDAPFIKLTSDDVDKVLNCKKVLYEDLSNQNNNVTLSQGLENNSLYEIIINSIGDGYKLLLFYLGDIVNGNSTSVLRQVINNDTYKVALSTDKKTIMAYYGDYLYYPIVRIVKVI